MPARKSLKGKTNTMNERKILNIYTIINIIFLLPVGIGVFYHGIYDVLPGVYMTVLLLYHVLKLTYLHFLIMFSMLSYFIGSFIKKKELIPFLVSLLLIAVCVLLNILWIINGKPFMAE